MPLGVHEYGRIVGSLDPMTARSEDFNTAEQISLMEAHSVIERANLAVVEGPRFITVETEIDADPVKVKRINYGWYMTARER